LKKINYTNFAVGIKNKVCIKKDINSFIFNSFFDFIDNLICKIKFFIQIKVVAFRVNFACIIFFIKRGSRVSKNIKLIHIERFEIIVRGKTF
jgi:hypothetical protein